jgi:histidyl-tRNA synthetase
MTSEAKERRPKAGNPKGFRDVFASELSRRSAMLAAIAGVYQLYGFDPLETPAVETLEALGKFLPDVDRPNEGVFAWQEEDRDWLALRYDLTAPLARVVAQYRNDLPSPYRRYAMGPVWRNEKPGPGRFRQFTQCDADSVGVPGAAADGEICMMLCDALEAAGIARGDYLVKVNNRKVLNGVLEVAGLAGDDRAEERGIVLRAIDKLDRLGLDGVRALLGAGRKDESGDFTRGAGLDAAATDIVLSFLSAKGATGAETLANLARIAGQTAQGSAGIAELDLMSSLAAAGGYGDRILIDPSIVRGLAYYTGPVFEAELTFDILDDRGARRQFGSVAGGGRYDDLVRRFTGQEVPATGVSIGVDRLLAALEARGQAAAPVPGPVVVTVMDRDRMADYFAMVAELRAEGIRAEVFLGNPKDMGRQLKYADQRGAPVAVIAGSAEHGRGTVLVKDLALGKELAGAITSNAEWKAQPAQREIPRAGLVSAVRGMLDRSKT